MPPVSREHLAMVHLPEGVSSSGSRNPDVLLRSGKVAPAHQRLEWNRRDSLVGVEAGSSRSQTVWIHTTTEIGILCCFLDTPVDCRAGAREGVVAIGEALDAEFDAEREVKGDCSGGCDGLRMPSKLQCLFFCEVVVACRFLGGLSTTVSTGTGFVLWNPNEHPIPVEPRRIEMRNLACSQPQSPCNQTDKTRLEIPRTGQFRARFQK